MNRQLRHARYAVPVTGLPDERHEVIFDLDGYLSNILKNRRPSIPELIAATPRNRQEVRQVCLLHFAFRSGSIPPSANDQNRWNVFKAFSKEALLRATIFARTPDDLIPPFWSIHGANAIRRLLREEFPSVDEVSLTVELAPRLHAWSDPSKRHITVSMLTREYLMQINLTLWNIVYQAIDEPEFVEDCGSHLLQCIIPHFWTLTRYSNHSALPLLKPYNYQALRFAMLTTKKQLDFLLAHEFAHVLLHEGSTKPRRELELEADEFAFDVAYRIDDLKGDLYIGLRWLFLTLAIERSFSQLLNGVTPDWSQAALRDRARTPQFMRLMGDPRHVSLSDNRCESVGSIALFKAKGILIRHGMSWVETVCAEWLDRCTIPSVQSFIDSLIAAYSFLLDLDEKEGR